MLIIISLALIMTSGLSTASAMEITAVKSLENYTLRTGDKAVVLLTFDNPFDEDVKIRLKDKNIFGNNGIDAQCLEYILPAKKKVTLSYSPIELFSPGEFTIGRAEVNYTDPETGKDMTILSNQININIDDSAAVSGSSHGITTIYQCNGVNMQSTSYSSSSASAQTQNQNNQKTQNPPNQKRQTHNTQNKLQNNQMNQNADQIKNDIYDQAEEQEKTREEFRDNLARNEDFIKEHQKMLNDGYNATTAEIDPETNNTGSFQVNYQNKKGETAQIKGRMNDGTMESLNSITEEDRKEMTEKLEQNEKYQKLKKELQDKGFNESQISFEPSENMTRIEQEFHNSQGDKKKITADYVNKTIQNVTKNEKQEENNKNNDYALFWILLFAMIMISCFFIYRKYFRKKHVRMDKEPKITKKKKSFDWKKESNILLEKAQKLFDSGQGKDAYGKVSEAVRLYLSYNNDLKKDLTSSDLIRELKKNKKEWEKIKECLDICSMAEFARYKTNKSDFEKIMDIGKKIIK